MDSINPVIMNGIILLVYIITFFLLLSVKSKIRKELTQACTYFMVAISLLIAIRIIDILITFDVFYVPFLQEAAVLALSLFLLLVSLRLYRYTKNNVI